MAVTRRRFLATTAAVSLAGCLGGGDETESVDLDGPVPTAPLPGDPNSYSYAMMGSADAPTVTYYGNWKCPHCATFSTGFLADIVTDYVDPGELSLTFRGLAYVGNGEPFLGPDAVTATRAGLSVWTHDPGSYWAFHEVMMTNQPEERTEWATADRLVSFARDAGVTTIDALRGDLESDAYEQRIRDTTVAAGQDGVTGTPTLVADGTAFSPFEEETARSHLDALTDGD